MRRRFPSDRRAVTAIEYGLIAAIIGSLIVASAAALGGDIGSVFQRLANFFANNPFP